MTRRAESSAAQQLRLQRDADERIRTRYRHFAELQGGPNPLTSDELVRLADQHPERWGLFRPRQPG